MKVSCPHCGQHFDVDDADVGKEADCMNCGKRFVLQASAEPPVSAPPAAASSTCPYCGGEIVSGVKKCRHCGEWLDMDARPRNQVVYCLLGIYGGVVGAHNFYAEEIERAAIKWGIGLLGAVLWGAAGNIGWLFCALGLNEIIALFDLAGCHSRVGIVNLTPPKTENKNPSMNNSKFPLNYDSLSHEE